MNPRVQRRLAALAACLALLVPSHTGAQEQKEWTWKDREGKTRTRAELERILAASKLWLESFQSRGSQADLSDAKLGGADLSDAKLVAADLSDAKLGGANLNRAKLISADLSHADLRGADLTGAELLNADLTGADLSNADLSNADLDGADLSRTRLSDAVLIHADLSDTKLIGAELNSADLTGARLFKADLTGADLLRADLDGAYLSSADLNGADVSGAQLNGAQLNGADLRGAQLSSAHLEGANVLQANLTGAQLFDAELKDADFFHVDLQGAYFEPKSNPEIRGIAAAGHLERMTYKENPDALVQLRKQFQENGFRTQERKITYALSRRKAELDGPVERWFQRVAFDLTCQYGMNPGRALQIWLALLLFCWLVYAVFIHVPGESGIYRLQKIGEPAAKEEIEEKIRPRMISSHPFWRFPFRLVSQELRVLFWAGSFSLMSAFNIGFRDINFGRWLRLLPRTEYDLKAKGWARTVAGFQSLISVYLIALWVLTYFGRPFE